MGRTQHRDRRTWTGGLSTHQRAIHFRAPGPNLFCPHRQLFGRLKCHLRFVPPFRGEAQVQVHLVGAHNPRPVHTRGSGPVTGRPVDEDRRTVLLLPTGHLRNQFLLPLP